MTLAVVLDTNVFISAIFWNGPPRTVIALIRSQNVQLLSMEEILAELEEKLNGKKLARYFEASGVSPVQVMTDYRKIVEIVDAVEVPEDVVRDPKDKMILACAVGAKADYIISGDKDLTILQSYRGIRILTPVQFVSSFHPQDE